jgi:hypothetical protein
MKWFLEKARSLDKILRDVQASRGDENSVRFQHCPSARPGSSVKLKAV